MVCVRISGDSIKCSLWCSVSAVYLVYRYYLLESRQEFLSIFRYLWCWFIVNFGDVVFVYFKAFHSTGIAAHDDCALYKILLVLLLACLAGRDVGVC